MNRQDRDLPLRSRNLSGRRFVCEAGKPCPPEAVLAVDPCERSLLPPERPRRNRSPEAPVFARPKALRSRGFAEFGKKATCPHPYCVECVCLRGRCPAVL